MALRVLHFPDWRGANPYQQLLADALGQSDVVVAFATYSGALLPLWRNLRRHRPDIIHIHWIADIIGANERNGLKYILKQVVFRIDVALVRFLLRGRVLWTVHNLSAHENRHRAGDLGARRYLARSVRSLVVHCASAKAMVSRAYGIAAEGIAVVPQGNYIGAYPNHASRGESRRRLGIPEDGFVFVHVGSLRPYKGVEELIKSFEALQLPGKYLVLAGACPDEDYTQQLRQQAASSRVQLEVRFIPPAELQYFFNASDAVVLPYREVLMSGSLLLAMGFGRMIVAPRLGCIPEHADTIGSVLYDADQPGALAAALEEASSRDVEACGRHNLERARSFDWQTMAEQTAALYSSLASRSHRA